MKYLISLPLALRKELLFRLGGVAVFSGLGIVCWAASMEAFLVLSAFLPALLCTGSAVAFAASCGKCLIIEGECLEAQRTLIKRRAKAILLDTQHGRVLVHLRAGRLSVEPGCRVRVYVKRDSNVYEQEGVMALLDPLAVEIAADFRRKTAH